MSTILDRIKTYKLEEIASRKAARPLAEMEEAAREATGAAWVFACPARSRGAPAMG